MRRKKGFTLMELVVVIAIFGVLIGVVTPAWTNYLRRSKFKAQNQKAKAIFNAAQTVIIDLDFSERKYYASGQKEAKKYIYTPEDHKDNGWYYYWDGKKGYQCNADGSPITVSYPEGVDGDFKSQKDATNNDWNEKIGNSIRRIVTDDMVYKIYIKDYKVQSVVSANNGHDRYIGAHPITILNLKSVGVKTNSGATDLEHTTARAVDLEWFDLDSINKAADGTKSKGSVPSAANAGASADEETEGT